MERGRGNRLLINSAGWKCREFWGSPGYLLGLPIPVVKINVTLELLFTGSSTKSSDPSGMKDLGKECDQPKCWLKAKGIDSGRGES